MGIIGGVALLALVVTAALFFYKKCTNKGKPKTMPEESAVIVQPRDETTDSLNLNREMKTVANMKRTKYQLRALQD